MPDVKVLPKVDEESLIVLEVADMEVPTVRIIEYTTAISAPLLLSYPPHASDESSVHGFIEPFDVVAPLSRAEPQRQSSPFWYAM